MSDFFKTTRAPYKERKACSEGKSLFLGVFKPSTWGLGFPTGKKVPGGSLKKKRQNLDIARFLNYSLREKLKSFAKHKDVSLIFSKRREPRTKKENFARRQSLFLGGEIFRYAFFSESLLLLGLMGNQQPWETNSHGNPTSLRL